ncbi:uncharacterized protein MELLADRAFT_92592 [Melampsora larici-populina 98AG31]|uniref:Secreted protein n=1 Tax=Melampsora larici-populina (strain 98AG31 / pathotype 3-4-7) TaxID=747676 RepID=F4S236_MELLP|nr:uncharacterized protein MELLADRAFT_92592 [Melampsora larici-populina 98AG31]EGG01329.1 secreted protein [Melampsora larici-populina 98AG31]
MRFAITVSFATLAIGLVTSQAAKNNAPTHNNFALVRRTTIVTQTNVTATIPKSNVPPVLSPPVGLRDALQNVHRIHNTIDPDAVNNDHGLLRRDVTITRPTNNNPTKPSSTTTVTSNSQTNPPPATSSTTSANPPLTTTVTTTSPAPAKPSSAPPPTSQTKPPPTNQPKPLSVAPPNPKPAVVMPASLHPAPPPGHRDALETVHKVHNTLTTRQDKQDATTALPAKLPTDSTACAAILKKMETAKASSAGTKSASSRRGLPGTYSYPLSRRAPQSGDKKPTTSSGSKSDDPCAKLAEITQKVKGAVSSAL